MVAELPLNSTLIISRNAAANISNCQLEKATMTGASVV
jgi:hypothetical protein